MFVDRHKQPVTACSDPECEWARLSERAHFDRHNPPCAELFVSTVGRELICELVRGHDGPHRGTERGLVG